MIFVMNNVSTLYEIMYMLFLKVEHLFTVIKTIVFNQIINKIFEKLMKLGVTNYNNFDPK